MTVVRALVTALLLTVVASGCGSAPPEVEPTPSEEVTACRAQWQRLNAEWETRTQSIFPSDLAERWTALAAGGAFQAATVTDGCQEQIRLAEGDARAIERLSGSLRVYDLAWQYDAISAPANAWIARATAATGKKAKARHRAARRAQRALEVLQTRSARAAEDMEAAWRAAVQTDLSDPEAMLDFSDSIRFVANDSTPYRKGSAALKRVKRLISRR